MVIGNRMETAPDSLLVAIQGDTAFVRVIKRGSFKTSPALKKFALSAVERGCRRIIVDMDECQGMDSTFMGVLAGLAMRLGQSGATEIALINVNARNMTLLETLGLNRMLRMHETLPDELKAWLQQMPGAQKLDTSSPGRKITAETMLAAHEDLVRVSPDNLPKFADVLTYLREDVKAANDAEKPR